MKKIVAVDVDGVVANNHIEWVRLYNRDYNDNLISSEITSWGIHAFVKPECGLKIYDYLEDPTLYDNVTPIEGALDGVNKLCQSYRVVYVTSSTPGASGAKYNWLKRYNFIEKIDDYVECRDKSLILADYLIDDYIENVKAFHGLSYLFTQAWNKELYWLLRINNWKEFLDENIKGL